MPLDLPGRETAQFLVWHVIAPVHRGSATPIIDMLQGIFAEGPGLRAQAMMLCDPGPVIPGAHLLDRDEIQRCRDYTRELAADDRICSRFPLVGSAVLPNRMHLMVICAASDLGQLVGRYKSKTASWLMQETPTTRRHIWAKGFLRIPVADQNEAGVLKDLLSRLDQDPG